MTHFDAHKLDEGSAVYFPRDRINPSNIATGALDAYHYDNGFCYAIYHVKKKWVNATRQIIRVQLVGRGATWYDPCETLQLVKK